MIEFKIDGQNLKVAQPFIVADTVDYLEGRIIFSRDWAELNTIYVHFSRTYGSYNDNFTIELNPKDPYIRKSHHLNLGSGSWSIWIHGCKFDGEETILRITTNKVAISVLATGSLNGETFPEFPKSIVEQVLSRLDNINKTVEELEEFETRLGDADNLYTVNKDTVVDAVNEVYEMATAARGRADLANTKADHALEIADGAEQDSYEAKGDAQNALDFARQAQATANGAYDVAFQAQHAAQNAESTANNAEQRSIDAIRQLASKQNTLVSGENVKTINGKSVLGAGNIEVEGGESELLNSIVDISDIQISDDNHYRLTRSNIGETSSPYVTYTSNNFRSVFISCKPGEMYRISLSGLSEDTRPFIVVDKNNVVVDKATQMQYNDFVYTIPPSADKISFNDYKKVGKVEKITVKTANVKDVQVNGTSVLADGVANIPLAKNGFGVSKTNYAYGISQNENGFLIPYTSNTNITARRIVGNYPSMIISANIDFAVKAAMCDGVGDAWTEDEQKSAQQRLGILSVEEVLF